MILNLSILLIFDAEDEGWIEFSTLSYTGQTIRKKECSTINLLIFNHAYCDDSSNNLNEEILLCAAI